MPRDPNSLRRFVLVELQRTAQGTYTETPVRFEWTSDSRSAPRHGWEYGVTVRTNREDYPGSDEPVEQVLGAHYDPQTFHGVWDDRWAGDGFAENQRVEFQKLVQRGNYVRCSFEGVTFTGIVTHYKPTYFTSFRTGYEFTLSPHFQTQGGDTRRGRILAPKTADPTAFLLEVDAIIDETLALHAASPGPFVSSDLVGQVASSVGDWEDRANTINAVIETRVLTPAGDGPNSVSRVIAGFQGMAASALALLPLFAATSTATDLAYEAAVPNLTFEVWKREVCFQARQMIVTCFNAARDLQKLVDPQAKAIYRPRHGESLYGISNRFYGTPHRWRDIADRNKLTGFTLSGIESLVIPNVAGKVSGQ
jgi:hypothetical protein